MQKFEHVGHFAYFLGNTLGDTLSVHSHRAGWLSFRPSHPPFNNVDISFHRISTLDNTVYLGLEYDIEEFEYDEDVAWLENYLAPLRGFEASFPQNGETVVFQGYGGIDPDPRILRLVEGAGLEKLRTTMRHDVYRLKRGVLRILRVGPEAGRAVEMYQESLTTNDSQEATIQLDLMRQDVALFNTIKRSLV